MEDNIFELRRNEDDGKEGIFAISLVEEPAIEEDAVYFSKEDDTYNFQIDEERGMMTGPIMIPGKKIPRPSKKKTVFFSKEGIEEEIYNLSAVPFTLNHGKNEAGKPDFVDGVKLAEKWVIEDSMDKAYGRGFDPEKLPIGTGMITAKFLDPANNPLWKKVKEQAIKGFSLEGRFANEEVEATEEHSVNAEISEIIEDYTNHKNTLKNGN
ncbi:MAG: hypothetical protein ACR2M7_01880 [Bdellovibrionales bacterium]